MRESHAPWVRGSHAQESRAMARVFVTRRLPGTALDRLAGEHEVEVWPGELPPSPKELRSHVADAEGLLSLLTDRIDADLLDAAPRLRAIANYAIGFDNIDVEAVTRARHRGRRDAGRPHRRDRGPRVGADARCRAPAARGQARRPRGRWRTWEPQGWLGADVHGATLAVVGAGRIGRAVARRAEGFEMDVLLVGPRRRLQAALERADFVSPARAADGRHPPSDRRGRARAHEADRDPRQHGARRARRQGRAGGRAAGGPARRRRARRHRPRAAARRRPAPAGPEPLVVAAHRLGHHERAVRDGRHARSTTCWRRWPATRCPIRRRSSLA